MINIHPKLPNDHLVDLADMTLRVGRIVTGERGRWKTSKRGSTLCMLIARHCLPVGQSRAISKVIKLMCMHI